jgi:small subunit ribosomal protein S16
LTKAVQWLHNGFNQLILQSYSLQSALLKHHLDGGIRKGALTQEQADAKLATWLEEKAGKVMLKEGFNKS